MDFIYFQYDRKDEVYAEIYDTALLQKQSEVIHKDEYVYLTFEQRSPKDKIYHLSTIAKLATKTLK